MKLAAIICEYNPLHNGHLHQMQETKHLTGADGILCIMSGNWTQRAECAIIDKYAFPTHIIPNAITPVKDLRRIHMRYNLHLETITLAVYEPEK